MLTLDELRALGRRPRLHPNGFIQFDIMPNVWRLNVWTPQALRSKPLHPIHNHSFDIRSTIITGMLTNITYVFKSSGIGEPFTTVLHRATRLAGHDSMLTVVEDIPAFGELHFRDAVSCNPGESYTLPRNVLHDSIPHGLTATIMRVENPDPKYGPLVAVPAGIEPDNEHRREEYDEEILWTFIDAALEEAKQHEVSLQ